jgi:two-component system sensor histidine kinase MtrB
MTAASTALRVSMSLRRPARRFVAHWRRSLQTRVVASTLVISATVVVLLGVVLMQQVTNGLLQAKTRAALVESANGLAYLQSNLSASDRTDATGLDDQLYELTKTLANRGSRAGIYDLALLSTSSSASVSLSGDITAASVPERLLKVVSGDAAGRQAWTFATLRHEDGRTEPGLVVGAPLNGVDAGPYQLYYLFPLRQEADTLALVRRTLFFTGLALVLLLAGIAALVARQVVRPVRAAARTAERLAAGRLEQRMEVRGEDDLARLASSFNRMAASLQSQIRQLEELSRVQRRFVADVSHELRTPLTTVRMAADVLHEYRGDFTPSVARSAELLQTQLDRFEALLADLLEISRHDAGAAVLEAEPVDLRDLVRRVAASSEPLAERRSSPLLLHLPARPVVVEVDPRRIERVLRNLVNNAIEHGEGQPIEITLAGDAPAAAVTVRDHGVGLRPGEPAMVFDRFWRADPARARATGGTGLGLSISLEDTHLHGGWLEAWGEPARGSQFRLTLPRHAGDSLATSPLALEPADAAAAAAPARRRSDRPAVHEVKFPRSPLGAGRPGG